MCGTEYFADHRWLLDISITSPIDEHPDLPTDMQMFAQLIVDEIIIQQTTPVDGVHTHNSTTWKLKFDCDMSVSFVNSIIPQLIALTVHQMHPLSG
jgi:hypothetical protein